MSGKETFTRRELLLAAGTGIASLVLVAGGCAIHTQGRQERNERLRSRNLPAPNNPADTLIENAQTPNVLLGGILVSAGISILEGLATTIWEEIKFRSSAGVNKE